MEHFRDEWPTMEDGSDFDGRSLLTLARNGQSPFRKEWDVMQLVEEIHDKLKLRVVDIPLVTTGSNSYGIHVRLSNDTDVLARLARGDVNMPGFAGFTTDRQTNGVKFEAAVYELVAPEHSIRASRLLYHRVPVEHSGPHTQQPQDILGRRLFLFEKAKGEKNVFTVLDETQKANLLAQSALTRAALFNFRVPAEFTESWLLRRVFEFMPESLPVPVAPTREFCVELFTSKICATIKNMGDMIGWEDDNETVGPIAFKAKESLLRLIPLIMPLDDEQGSLYRLVLEHGDFGIHNMSITMDGSNQPLITSLYDWEVGCIVPAILSDPIMSVIVDLSADDEAGPAVSRTDPESTPSEHEEYRGWAKTYLDNLFHHAPDYEKAIKAGKDARHLWYALRDWKGETPEQYFGDLGTWAEKRIQELESR